MSGVGPTRALSAGGAGPLDASVCVECANNELTTEHGTRVTTKVRTRPQIPSGHTRVRKLNTNQTPDPEWVSAPPPDSSVDDNPASLEKHTGLMGNSPVRMWSCWGRHACDPPSSSFPRPGEISLTMKWVRWS